MPEFEAIIKDKTGNFFEYGDVRSLVDCIVNWLDSHQDREAVRQACFDEIDNFWTPQFQMDVLTANLKVD